MNFSEVEDLLDLYSNDEREKQCKHEDLCYTYRGISLCSDCFDKISEINDKNKNFEQEEKKIESMAQLFKIQKEILREIKNGNKENVKNNKKNDENQKIIIRLLTLLLNEKDRRELSDEMNKFQIEKKG